MQSKDIYQRFIIHIQLKRFKVQGSVFEKKERSKDRSFFYKKVLSSII